MKRIRYARMQPIAKIYMREKNHRRVQKLKFLSSVGMWWTISSSVFEYGKGLLYIFHGAKKNLSPLTM